MNNLYLVLTSGFTPDNLKRIVQALPVKAWWYLGPQTANRVALERALADRARWISIADSLEEISRKLREPFLELMADLTKRNRSLLWWGSALGSKNPYSSSLFLDCCFLMIGRDLSSRAAREDRLLVVESPALLHQLTVVATQAGASVRCVTSTPCPLHGLVRRSWTSLRSSRWWYADHLRRRAVLRRHGMLGIAPFAGPDTALLCTWIDQRSFGPNGNYCDPHFGDLLSRHLDSRGYRVAYVTRVLPTISFEEAAERLRGTGQTCVFPEAVLRPADIVRSISRAYLYRIRPPRPTYLAGLDITDLIAEQGEPAVELARNFSYHALVRRLAGRGVAPSLLFHTMEGHGWERVLCQGVRDYLPRTQVVACNSGTFTSMLLCMHPARAEMNCLPLPDWIVTNGPQLQAVLQKAGYPAGRVLAGADLRRGYLWERPALGERPVRSVVQVLVASEIGLDRSVELVDKALRALAGLPRYRVIVKCHPMVDSERVVALTGERGRAENVCFTAQPIAELLPQADVLLYTQTAVCFEALRHGVVPIFVRAEGWLNMDQLEHALECRWVATSPEEIRAVVEEILALPAATWWQWYHHAQEVLARHYAPATPELLDRFLDFPAPDGDGSGERTPQGKRVVR